MEKGSFITQYIECKDCLKHIRNIFLKHQNNNMSLIDVPFPKIKGMDMKLTPIISGYISMPEHLNVLAFFDNSIREDMEVDLCMPLNIAILSVSTIGHEIINYLPAKKVKHEKSFNDRPFMRKIYVPKENIYGQD